MNWNDEPRAPRPGTPGGVPPQRPDRAAPRRVPPSPGPRHEPRHARGSVPPPAAGPSPDPGRGPEGGVRVEPRADRPGRIDETRYRQRHSGETDAVDSRASRNAGDEEASPTGLARDSDSSILRTSGSIAIATLFSRITGFLRTVLILAMLGSGIASAFQAADVLPNMIAEVVLGAVLTAIVIPLLARAEAEDPDGGQGFINRIFTITVVVLGTATVFAVIAAPALTYMNLGDGQVNRDLSTHLAYLLLPEILFYGLSALFIAILNVRGLFKPGAWAPVLNNVVQITTLVLYALVPGEITLNPVRMSDPQLLVLGVGCTLGVVLQAMVLVPFLKKAGVHLRLEWGIDARLRQFGNMAVAIVAYVALLQVGLVATYRIASSAEASGVSIYFTHWQLLQLPYGVLGVTILTAIMPRLSRNAAADNAKAVVDDLSLATRLTMVALVPVVSFMTFFGPAIAIAVFNFGRFEAADANQLGSVLAWGAFTLIPYSMTLVQLRVFYAREDAWTPTFIALGITVVKVGSSYLGPVLFDNPSNVVRWLALSNGLGYLVGAIVGHFLLRSRLGGARMTNVVRTTLVTFAVSIGVSATVWFVAKTTGLDGMIGWAGKLGSLIYLALTAAVVLAVTYAGLAAAQVPDVVAIGNSVRRVLGRFIPALAPPPEPERDQSPAITVAFPRVSADESLPYSGQVQVLRRFDRGTATWQSYSVHTGGAIGAGRGPRPIPPRAPVPRDIRYRRKGVRRVSDSELDTTAAVGSPADSGPGSTSGHSPTDVQTPENPVHANPATEATGAPTPPVPPRRVRPRGPRLVPGAVVAGGRYRLLERHGGSRGLQFWRALDINLDREVALTFVDAEQLAPPPEPGQEIRPTDQGPQAVLTRTLRLGQITHDGVARVLDVVRGSSGGIVVAEWVPGSSLAEVARTKPSPIGAARAVRSLAAAAEIAHRSGGALSIDHPDRIRISHDGNAVLAFPGTLAGDDKASDVRGLGAVLYALLLNRWTLDPETGSRLITTDDVTEPVGGIPVAEPGDDGRPREPRAVDPEIPFEISAVAARALDGTRGIRTAATVQHVLDQATVVDLNTDMLPAITDADAAPPVSVTPRIGSNEGSPKRRNTALLIGAGLLAIFVVIALIVGATNVFGGDEGSSDIDSIIPTSEPAPAGQPAPGADAPTAGPTQEIPLQAVSVLDFSAQTPDNPANVANVISGQVPVWQTDNYRGRPDFGGLKQGLGLMFDLGAERPVKSVTIDSPTPGFDVEIRTSPSATPAFARTTPVAAARVDSDSKTIELAEPATSRYVMVWITSLPESPNGGYQAQISKVTMEG